MSNPLYGQFGGQQNNNAMSAFMNDFHRLQQTVRNPRQDVERLLQSGAMSQSDFNRLGQMANQLMGSPRK
jgi:hypothetical protein